MVVILLPVFPKAFILGENMILQESSIKQYFGTWFLKITVHWLLYESHPAKNEITCTTFFFKNNVLISYQCRLEVTNIPGAPFANID